MEDLNIWSSHLPEYASNAAPISSLAFPKFIVSNSCSLISPEVSNCSAIYPNMWNKEAVHFTSSYFQTEDATVILLTI